MWEEEQWEKLFESLFEEYKNSQKNNSRTINSYLGTIVFKNNNSDVNDMKNTAKNLIDGQQRFITFSILIKSIYDRLDEEEQADYTEVLFRNSSKKETKIKQSANDKNAFEKILQAKSYYELDNELKEREPNKKKLKNKLVRCYEYFSEKIKTLEKEEFKEFLEAITESNIFVFTFISDEDEQKVFDSINTTGIILNSVDIIKNTIFDILLKQTQNEEKVKEIYEKYWEKTFEEEIKPEENFWDTPITIGREKRKEKEILFRSIALMKGIFTPNDGFKNLSKLYKNHFKNKVTQYLEDFLKQMQNIAKIYKEFRDIDIKETSFVYENYQLRLLHIIRIFDTTIPISTLVILKDKLKDKQELLKKCFELIEIFLITTFYKKNQDFNKLFGNLTREIAQKNNDDIYTTIKEKLENDYKNRFNIKELEQQFNNLQKEKSKFATLILFWIELYKRSSDKMSVGEKTLTYDYTLEHLIPRKWEDHYKGWFRDSDDAEKYINQIGNMTLLTIKTNVSISNKALKDKKNPIKENSTLKISDDLQEWDENNIKENINKRTKSLIKDFKKIWDIEKLGIKLIK